jgi:hypothetical protein
MTVHLLVDGYRVIACRDGDGVSEGEQDTSNVAKVTYLACLERGLRMHEARANAIATRLWHVARNRGVLTAREAISALLNIVRLFDEQGRWNYDSTIALRRAGLDRCGEIAATFGLPFDETIEPTPIKRCDHPCADTTCDGKNHNHPTDLDAKSGQPWDD